MQTVVTGFGMSKKNFSSGLVCKEKKHHFKLMMCTLLSYRWLAIKWVAYGWLFCELTIHAKMMCQRVLGTESIDDYHDSKTITVIIFILPLIKKSIYLWFCDFDRPTALWYRILNCFQIDFYDTKTSEWLQLATNPSDLNEQIRFVVCSSLSEFLFLVIFHCVRLINRYVHSSKYHHN